MNLQSTLPNLLSFCCAYEHRSFSKAARALGVTPQAVSRSILRLEATLDVALFRRTTRRLTPTEAGHAYFQTASEALSLIRDAEATLTESSRLRSGRVRLSVPTTYAHYRLPGALVAFQRRFPQIDVEVHAENRNVDFAAEEYDLAVRMGTISQPGLIARRLGQFALGVYASPSYLARHGAPQSPAELDAHKCIAFLRPSTGRVIPWSFMPGPRSYTPKSQLRCAGDFVTAVHLAASGAGLVNAYDFLAENHVRQGQLVEVLEAYRGSSRPFSIIYPVSPKLTPAASALVATLLAQPR